VTIILYWEDSLERNPVVLYMMYFVIGVSTVTWAS